MARPRAAPARDANDFRLCQAAAVLPRMLRSNPALMVLVVAFVAIGTVLGIFFVVVFSGMVMARTLRALDAAGFFAP